MAQSSHETGQYLHWVENLNYSSPSRLPAVWPKRFSLIENDPSGKAYAQNYVGNPEKLANFVYASRGGNGDQASGDGWKFRGRGAFHLTFKANYVSASKALYNDDRLVTNPDLVSTEWEYRWATAGFFWDTNKMNALADADQFTQVCIKIQGDASTVAQRQTSLTRANSIFK